MFTLQEQRERFTLHMIDTGSQRRRPDGPSLDDSTRVVEGSSFFLTRASRSLRGRAAPRHGFTSIACNVFGIPQRHSHLNDAAEVPVEYIALSCKHNMPRD